MDSGNYWEGIIDRFEEDRAIIVLGDQQLLWPRKNLPADAREGSAVKLNISTDKQAEQISEAMAKKILNEILQTNNQQS